MHVEAIAEHRACGPEHQRVDDEEKQSQRDQRDRQGEDDEHRPQNDVEQADDGGCDQGAGEASHFDAAVDAGHEQQCGCAEQPFEQEFHGLGE